MSIFLRIAISKLYNTISAPVAATRNALAERLQSVHETASLLKNRMMDKISNGRERLKNIVENEAQEETKEQQNDDGNEQYDMIPNIKLVCERTRVIEFWATGLLYWREYIHVFIGFELNEFTLRSIDSKVLLAWP